MAGGQWRSEEQQPLPVSKSAVNAAASGAAVMMELLDSKREDCQRDLEKQEVQAVTVSGPEVAVIPRGSAPHD